MSDKEVKRTDLSMEFYKVDHAKPSKSVSQSVWSLTDGVQLERALHEQSAACIS